MAYVWKQSQSGSYQYPQPSPHPVPLPLWQPHAREQEAPFQQALVQRPQLTGTRYSTLSQQQQQMISVYQEDISSISGTNYYFSVGGLCLECCGCVVL